MTCTSMKVINKKYSVVCPVCKKKRIISYWAYRRIIKKETTGQCKYCFNKNGHRFKRGNIPWNKGKGIRIKEDIRLYRNKWREDNKERVNLYFKKYYSDHPLLKEDSRRYRAKRRCTGEISKVDLERVKEIFDYCYICGKKFDKYEIDHIYPISKGGDNSFENLALACITCNRKKHNKLLEDFVNGNLDYLLHQLL